MQMEEVTEHAVLSGGWLSDVTVFTVEPISRAGLCRKVPLAITVSLHM